MKAYFARRVDDPHQVADLTADTFLAAMTGSAGLPPGQGQPGRLAAGHRPQPRSRSLVRRQARRLRAESRIWGADCSTRTPLPGSRNGSRPSGTPERCTPAWPQLSGRDRALMELVAVDGMPVKEAAEQLGMKPGTARVRLHRCRTRLQQHLDTYSPPDSVEDAAAAVLAQEA